MSSPNLKRPDEWSSRIEKKWRPIPIEKIAAALQIYENRLRKNGSNSIAYSLVKEEFL